MVDQSLFRLVRYHVAANHLIRSTFGNGLSVGEFFELVGRKIYTAPLMGQLQSTGLLEPVARVAVLVTDNQRECTVVVQSPSLPSQNYNFHCALYEDGGLMFRPLQ